MTVPLLRPRISLSMPTIRCSRGRQRTRSATARALGESGRGGSCSRTIGQVPVRLHRRRAAVARQAGQRSFGGELPPQVCPDERRSGRRPQCGLAPRIVLQGAKPVRHAAGRTAKAYRQNAWLSRSRKPPSLLLTSASHQVKRSRNPRILLAERHRSWR